MRHFILLLLPMLAFIATSAGTTPAQAAAGGIQDDAPFFTPSGIARAEELIHKIRSGDHRDVLVVTYKAVPDNMKDVLSSKGEQRFFKEWAEDVALEKGVSGVIILMVKNPGHLQIEVGNKTREGIFTLDDREELKNRMLPLLKDKRDDDALLEGLQFIKTTMDRHPAKGAAAVNPATPLPPTYTPTPNYPPTVVHQSTGSGFHVGGLVCLGIAILIVVFLIMAVANRNRNYGGGGGYGAPPPGGYPPGYSGPYPQQGGGYYGGGGGVGGGGGGFGRGLLGGLLGGALGAWGYEKFNQPNQSPNYVPPQPNSTGGYPDTTPDQTDTSFSGTGADFDSGSSSTDPGSSNDSSGSDFSGDDSGGGDSGGGGGGDSGGGGGDSGGGGDF